MPNFAALYHMVVTVLRSIQLVVNTLHLLLLIGISLVSILNGFGLNDVHSYSTDIKAHKFKVKVSMHGLWRPQKCEEPAFSFRYQ